MSVDLASSAEARAKARGDELAGQLRALSLHARELQRNAEREKDWRTALIATREICRISELIAKLSGQIGSQHVTVDVVTTPSEAIDTAEQLLFALLNRDEMTSFVQLLQKRLTELSSEPPIIEGNTEDSVSAAPLQLSDSTQVASPRDSCVTNPDAESPH